MIHSGKTAVDATAFAIDATNETDDRISLTLDPFVPFVPLLPFVPFMPAIPC